jgi:predicted TIM-barrel enzyme
MNRPIDRQEILRRLRREIAARRPILGAGCSAGLIAKCAEIGKADLIIVYSTGKTRMMGLPTTITGESNTTTLGMYDELANVVHDTPIIAGVEANDVHYLDLNKSLQRFLDKGFNGVINFPTVSLYENLIAGGMGLRMYNESLAGGFRVAHWGWSRECEMVRLLHEGGVFTMAYVFSPADATDMATAGVDAVCAHVGPTMGGLAGQQVLADLDALLQRAQDIFDAARQVNPEVIRLIHGGPFYNPESTKVVYEKTDAQGFVAASAIERTPVEVAVTTVCQEYKQLPMPRG